MWKAIPSLSESAPSHQQRDRWGDAPLRSFLTIGLLTLLMLSSTAMGSSEKWMLLVMGASWAPLLTLILVPLLKRRPMMSLVFLRQETMS